MKLRRTSRQGDIPGRNDRSGDQGIRRADAQLRGGVGWALRAPRRPHHLIPVSTCSRDQATRRRRLHDRGEAAGRADAGRMQGNGFA